MPDAPPPDLPASHQPPPPARGGAATELASSISSSGYGVDPDADDPGGGGFRLAVLLGVLALIGVLNPWMLVVIVAVLVMIFLHELGHYVTAKRAGMKVTEFFLGFGPKIWSFRRGETEYGLKAIPAGAYVKIPGMVNLDEVDPADEARTYRQKSFGARLSVAVAGSTMHFILAIGLIYVALVAIGQPGGSLTSAPSERPAVVERVFAGSGAAAAGLQVGDRITGIDGVATPTAASLQDVVATRRGSEVPVTLVRDGRDVRATVDVQAYEYRGQRSCGLGIRMEPPRNERIGPVEGLVAAPREFVEIVWLSGEGLVRFFSPSGIGDFASQVGSAQDDRSAARNGQQVDPDADPCAVAPAGAAAGTAGGSGGSTEGENRILSIYGLVSFGADVGGVDPGALIGLFALINIFIGMFNLIPLLPFDGGHVAIAVYERFQELRQRKRRHFADISRLLPLTYGVVILLAMLFFSSLYLDIVNPIGG